MSDEKPSPLEDVRKGLGLLFRAAKTAVERLPSGGVEGVVATSAREVGRAIENVAATIEREVFGKRSGPPPSPQSTEEARSKPPDPPDPPAEKPQPPEPKPPGAA
jgi:hypothetical protein